ncbi:MAG TPA: FtsX-like permease family protein [Vicinamibacterales bacterium]|jgi:putative ABC transport system permease protein|nr:FtsX-like permease family protein [Vicinamibacterales bacterium]
MMFVLRMAVRETRASWRRLLFFFVCIAVGVAAIVALRSVIQNVRVAVNGEARALVGADVVMSTNREWTPEARQKIDTHLAAAGAFARTETTETPTMVRPADPSKPLAKMAELRAVQSGYPLYGTITLQQAQVYSHALLRQHGTLVRPELLTALNVEVGDRIAVGETTFTIRGVIAKEPGSGPGGFSLGPRIYIDYDDLASTGLLGFGSRAGRLLFVRVPDDRVPALMTALRQDLRQDFVNARSYRSREDQVGRDFDRAEDYLSLVGLVIVILGGIAVSSVTRVFILQKIRSIAVLKCIGARNAQIIAVYILQVMALGLAGSLLGVAVARAAVAAIPLALKSSSASLLTEAHYGVTWSAAVQGVAIGVLVSLLFSVVPLLHVRFIKPSLLLRDETARRRRDWLGMAALVVVSLALVGVTAWQASSLRVGIVVCTGFAGLAFVLHLAGKALVALVAPLANAKSFPLRHAVLHLSRPGNQTRVVLLAVGLGAFFIVGIRSLQASLLDEFSFQTSADSPDMFLLDIQRGQADGVRAFLGDAGHGAGTFQLIPVLRARVVGVSGREMNLNGPQEVRERGVSLGREFTLTYRDHLEPNERVIDGAFWSSPSAEPEVSVEREIAERARLHVGDTIQFDILGRVVSPRITSIRNVEWRESRNGGFVFVFRPGALDQAPQMFVSPLKGPADPAARARFQHDLVQRFPNVSVIDFRDVLERIRDVMSKVTLAITVVGGLVLFSGALILVGAVAMTKFQRVYEAAVFKTLGANTRMIGRMLLFEYGVLGSLAGIIGSAGAVALTWGVSKYALEIPWKIFVTEHVAGVVLTAILVAAIGVVSSLDVLRHKPLATLRAE